MKRIVLTETLSLQAITLNDFDKLYHLMNEIYPKSYESFWTDKGRWYVNSLYNLANIQTELAETNAAFYFVNFEQEAIGILRVLYHETYPKFPKLKATKLHRIYLHPKTHRKGVGKALMNWTIEQAKIAGDEILWLEGMDTKPEAILFYKKMGFRIGSHVTLPYERLLIEKRGMHQMWLEII